MTEPEDSQGSTRPISVAELLAKNGTIGAPPAGGRRRRRRGSDSVTVAELTGEIPIIRGADDERDATETTRTLPVVTDEPSNGAPTLRPERDHVPDDDTDDEVVESPDDLEGGDVDVIEADEDQVAETAADDEDEAAVLADVEVDDDVDDDYADAVADYAAHIENREADDALNFFTPARRSSFAPRRFKTDADRMNPDPVVDEIPLDTDDDGADVDDLEVEEALGDSRDRDDLPSYLRSPSGGLFGGPSVGDGLTRPSPEDIDLDDSELEDDAAPATSMSSFARGAWVVGQCVLAVAFGAGLFIAFDQLWKWNNIVALVLSVLVILGLVVGVRVVRKTEDIGSTLIAVAVGALVTLGPLALLQSG
jgi:hypothetical protein